MRSQQNIKKKLNLIHAENIDLKCQNNESPSATFPNIPHPSNNPDLLFSRIEQISQRLRKLKQA